MTIIEEIAKIKAALALVEKNLTDIAFKAISKNKKQIIKDYLQEGQLSKGFSSSGDRLSFYTNGGKTSGFYTKATVKKAKFDKPIKPKRLGSPYNFQWSGDTFKGMDIKKDGNGFEIFTKDPKNLEEFYGNIYDLNEENEKEVNETFVEPEFEKKIFESISF